MPLFEFDGKAPDVHPTAFVAPTATLVGEVTVEEGASVWYGAVIRADFSPVVVRAEQTDHHLRVALLSRGFRGEGSGPHRQRRPFYRRPRDRTVRA